MSSDRKAFRLDVISRLMGKTSVGTNVLKSRTIPIPDDVLSAIVVSTKNEREELVSNGSEPSFKATLTIVIECIVAETASGDHDDLADDLADEVSTVLFKDPDWVKQFEKISAINTVNQYYMDGDRLMASAEMSVDVEYTTRYEPVVTDDFVTMKINMDAIDPADANEHEADGTWPEGYGGQPGPDKRIEVAATLTMEQEP